MSSIVIRQIIGTDIPELIEIADDLFGANFISKTEFRSYILDASKIGLVATHEDSIAGFLLLHVCEMNELLKYTVSEKEWFHSHFSKLTPVGVYKSIGVATQFKKQGIGNLLTRKGIELLHENVKSIVAICWEQDETPLLHLLENFKFNFARKINHFWTEDSLEKKYSCEICGEPPCQCNAFIYTLLIG